VEGDAVIKVALNNQQQAQPVDRAQLKEAAKRVLAGEGIDNASISLAVVDDANMHRLNRQYLQHDYPTDVLSFLLEDEDDRLEGEIIISADYAAREAAHFGWTPQQEMLLYVIHGTLHLAGYDDLEPDLKTEMRAKEREYLATFGLTPTYDD
jgi:probable rRNA maturation factor